MKLKLKTLFVLICAVASGVLLLYTSQAVQNAESKLRTAKSDLMAESEKVTVLEAEWAFLSAPDRIETFAQKYLGLSEAAPSIVSENALKTEDDTGYQAASYTRGAQ